MSKHHQTDLINLNCLSGVQQSPRWGFGRSPRTSDGRSPRKSDERPASAYMPGPGNYHIGNTWTSRHKSCAKVKFGTAPRFRTQTGGRRERHQAPGPASYTPHHETYLKKAQAATIGSGHRQKGFNSWEDTPGPGAYNSNYAPDKPPTYKMTPRTFVKKDDDTGPGPGAYSKTGIRPNGKPGFSFGAATTGRAMNSRRRRDIPVYPGPGQYTPVDVFSKTAPGYTISQKRYDKSHVDPSPGPGQYGNCTTFDVDPRKMSPRAPRSPRR